MRKPPRIRLRNKIIKHLNQWQQLGCLVREYAPPRTKLGRGQNRFMNRLIGGVSKDGRAILLYPIRDRRETIPRLICELMLEYDGRGAIVGTCLHIGDAWDCVFNDEKAHKRKQQTWSYRYWAEKHKNRSKEDE